MPEELLYLPRSCLQAVEVDGDSLKVIQAIVATKPSRTLFGNVIADIHCLVANFNYSFCHFKREGNKLAHALARRAVVFADFDVWLEDLPRDLEDVFQFDL